MLNSESPVPLYHQLADIILAKIRANEYPPGSKIPSEHRLAEQFGVGRPTVRQATDLLMRRRYLTRRRGAGTFVLTQPDEVDLFSLAGTLSAFQRKGLRVQTRILHNMRLDQVALDPENPFAGFEAFFFARLSSVDGTPVLKENIYLHPVLFSGIDQVDLKGRSLSQVVEEVYYMRPKNGDQNFRIAYLSGREAEALEVTSETPLLLAKRFLHFNQAENAVFSELYCRTDQFVFSQTIGGR
jgi:GntR family transcriptional regulator